MDYNAFIASKGTRAEPCGFEPGALHGDLSPFQAHAVRWAVRTGRAAMFEDCGLGKTRQQIEWARQVAQHTGRRVLILAPLAVAGQTVREAQRIGIPLVYAQSPASAGDAKIVITNYERLDAWLADAEVLGGVVLDESSILKSYMGTTKRLIVDTFRDTPYRLACTATPAPNDHLELGNHAEFLGVMTSNEMIARWFLPDTSTFGTYRIKGHGVTAYWDWVSSWAVCVERPSDIGPFEDAGYNLPSLRLQRHVIDVDLTQDRGGDLFRVAEMNATSIHKERRLTATSRAAKVASLVAAESSEPWIVWCETDYEADALTAAMPDAVEVRGSHSVERKESALTDFSEGRTRVLVTKPSIAGFGLNWQHCARVAFVGATFSYEQFYQAIRRTWRYGQTRDVDVHVTLGATEISVWNILTAKRDAHDEMKSAMFAAARRAQSKIDNPTKYQPGRAMVIPSWLTSERVK